MVQAYERTDTIHKLITMKISSLALLNCLKTATIGTLIIGMYCHLSRLVFGIDNLQHYLLTPSFEGFFTLPMIVVAAMQLAFIKRIAFRNIVEKVVFYFSTFQFLVSVPLHAWAFVDS